jgi:hypothetical protein
MSREFTILITAIMAACALQTARAEIVDFEDLPLAPGSYYTNNYQAGEATFQSGATTANPNGGATFNYNGEYVDTSSSPPVVVWAGWSYANTPTPATASIGGPGDYIYQYDAAAPTGAGGSATYAMGYYDPYNNVVPTITLPAGEHPVSVQVTNSTFTALAMQYYDGYTPVYSTANADRFTLTITGYDAANQAVGAVHMNLADFNLNDTGAPYVVQNWTNVNLSSLYNAQTLAFTMSYDNKDGVVSDPINILTPTYVAIDNLSLTKVPGDANGDGIVNGQDLALVSSSWLQSTPGADVNGDGIVNGQDLALMSSNWLATPTAGGASASAVPEPGSAVLALLGLALVTLGRKLRR